MTPTAHFILYVADQERSAVFYAAALGQPPRLHVPGMTEFALPGGAVLGLMPEAGIRRLLGPALPGPGQGRAGARCELYLLVDDPAAGHARALAAGAHELSPLQPRDWGHMAAYALDPDHHVLAFAAPMSEGASSGAGAPSTAPDIIAERPILAVLVHVPDPEQAVAWYARALPGSVRHRLPEPGLVHYLDIGGVMLELVPSDEKVASGAAGSVVYWHTPDFDASFAHLVACGATPYRGPGDIEGGQRMCQVRDPWGNCIGLRGPG